MNGHTVCTGAHIAWRLENNLQDLPHLLRYLRPGLPLQLQSRLAYLGFCDFSSVCLAVEMLAFQACAAVLGFPHWSQGFELRS